MGYYYIKHRSVWYAVFDISCFTGEILDLNSDIYLEQVKVLSSIYKLFKQLEENNFIIGCKYLDNNIKMFKWFLEGSITNYETIKNEQSNIYYQLKDVYTSQNKENKESNNQSTLTSDEVKPNCDIELLDIYENNIIIIKEIIKQINNSASSITKFQSHYLIALISDILYYCNVCIHYNSIL